MTLKEADQILSRYADVLAAGLKKGREVYCWYDLADSTDQIKLAIRVVLASLVELQMRTGTGQANAVQSVMNAAQIIFAYASPDQAEKIQAHAHEKINRERNSFTVKSVEEGQAFRDDLGKMMNAIIYLDLNSASFRMNVDSLVGTRTEDPLKVGGGSEYRNQ